MFREMRRKNQQLSYELAEKLLEKCLTGILGVSGDDGYPYTVPVNFVYQNKAVYIHCATEGHKLDSIRKNAKVSFCVIEKDDVIPEDFTTNYRSAVTFGLASEVTDIDERLMAMRLLCRKYAPGHMSAGEDEISNAWNRLCVIKINVLHITGKEGIGLLKKRD